MAEMTTIQISKQVKELLEQDMVFLLKRNYTDVITFLLQFYKPKLYDLVEPVRMSKTTKKIYERMIRIMLRVKYTIETEKVLSSITETITECEKEINACNEIIQICEERIK